MKKFSTSRLQKFQDTLGACVLNIDARIGFIDDFGFHDMQSDVIRLGVDD